MKDINSGWVELLAWLPLHAHRFHIKGKSCSLPYLKLRVTFNSGKKPDYNIFMRYDDKMFKFSTVQNGNFIEIPVRSEHSVIWVVASEGKEVGYLEYGKE